MEIIYPGGQIRIGGRGGLQFFRLSGKLSFQRIDLLAGFEGGDLRGVQYLLEAGLGGFGLIEAGVELLLSLMCGLEISAGSLQFPGTLLNGGIVGNRLRGLLQRGKCGLGPFEFALGVVEVPVESVGAQLGGLDFFLRQPTLFANAEFGLGHEGLETFVLGAQSGAFGAEVDKLGGESVAFVAELVSGG